VTIVCAAAAGPASAFEAGAGRADITPPLGTPLNGYSDRLGRGAIDVHDPLYARCLYLSDGETAILWVTMDLCAITPQLRARILELAPPDVAHDNIILSATHTHSGTGGMIEAPLVARFVSGRYVPEVLEMTANKVADAMRAALKAKKPASIGYCVSQEPAALAEMNMANASADAQLGIIRVDDADGNPIAILANAAAHPTTVRGENKLSISADFPGAFCTSLESAVPGCMAMFANGAEGDQRPVSRDSQKGWSWTEAIGEQIADRVKAVADKIHCSEATVKFSYSEPQLPPTLAAGIMPSSTILQALEINDLLLEFVPAETCADVGLELRKHALARGYAAQCTIGVSNDHIAYIVSPQAYGDIKYETKMSFYGPHMAQWLRREFGKLMSRGEADPELPPIEQPTIEGSVLSLAGCPYTIGYQRGLAFKQEIQDRYQSQIVAPVETGALAPKEISSKSLPSWLDLSKYALPLLGIEARALLSGVSPDLIDQIQGMADAAELPFDAAWLSQCSQVLAPTPETEEPVSGHDLVCASVGDRAGSSGVVVGALFNLPEASEKPMLVDVQPDSGHRYAYLGSAWGYDTFAGINDAGVVVCIKRKAGAPVMDGAPIDLVARDILQTAKNAEEALAALQKQTHLKGVDVTVAAPAAGKNQPAAYRAKFGTSCLIEKPVKGLLVEGDDERTRLLSEEHIVSGAKMKKLLQQCVPDSSEQQPVLVVFEPKSRSLTVDFAGDASFTTLSVKGASS